MNWINRYPRTACVVLAACFMGQFVVLHMAIGGAFS